MLSDDTQRKDPLPGHGRKFARHWPRGLVALGIVVLLGLGGAAAWKRWFAGGSSPVVAGAPVEDPRLTFATPYRNVHPDVKYVGDGDCANCHFAHAESYRHHPMGQSFFPVAEAPALERYDATARNTFEARGAHFAVERRGDRVFHKQTHRGADGKAVAEVELEVHYAMGSGRQGRSYLVRRGEHLVQSPLSWYSHKGQWDLSPGYEKHYQSFNRGITADCAFCHCNDADHVEHTINRYRPPAFRQHALGCERCHGPGELHVQKRRSGDESAGFDDTIVNPARLEPALREAVCQQCHLQGEARVVRRGRKSFDFRPGLPLHLFLAVFVRPPELSDGHRSVGQVEQMYLSRCFQKSGRKLGCISCHDPHSLPADAERVTFYRDRCLQCHTEQSCGVPPAERRRQHADDSCIACHMAAGSSTSIAHAAVTDHRILRRPDATPVLSPRRRPQIPLEFFHRDLVSPQDPEAARDLGLAIIKNARPAPENLQHIFGRSALPFLEQAVARDPGDAAAWEALGNARWYLRLHAEALAATERALALAPEREFALEDAASYSARMHKMEAAIGYWRRALEVNPWHPDTHFYLARDLMVHGDYAGGAEAARAALAVDPSHVPARSLLVTYYVQRSEREQARAEFEKILALKPPDEEALKRWFEQQMR